MKRATLLTFSSGLLSVALGSGAACSGGRDESYLQDPLPPETTTEVEQSEEIATTGRPRSPNLPAKVAPDVEAIIKQYSLAASRMGGGGGGGTEGQPRTDLAKRYDELTRNNSAEQNYRLVKALVQKGRAANAEQPCERLMAMYLGLNNGLRQVASEEERATFMARCREMPSELLACVENDRDRSPRERRRCQRSLRGNDLFGDEPPGGSQAPAGAQMDEDGAIPLPRGAAQVRLRSTMASVE